MKNLHAPHLVTVAAAAGRLLLLINIYLYLSILSHCRSGVSPSLLVLGFVVQSAAAD